MKCILYVQSQSLNNVSNLVHGEHRITFNENRGYFCHPNTNMSAENINDAKEECITDQSCDMFYRVCNYSEFRKCNNTGKAEYEEISTCGHSLGHSSLFKKGTVVSIHTYICFAGWGKSIECIYMFYCFILRLFG